MEVDGERPSEVALGQAHVRRLNEQLVSESLDLDPSAPSLAIHCECGRFFCRTKLDVSQLFYLRIRQRANRFVVAEDHQVAEVDRVVQRVGRLTVIESTYVGDAVSPGD